MVLLGQSELERVKCKDGSHTALNRSMFRSIMEAVGIVLEECSIAALAGSFLILIDCWRSEWATARSQSISIKNQVAWATTMLGVILHEGCKSSRIPTLRFQNE